MDEDECEEEGEMRLFTFDEEEVRRLAPAAAPPGFTAAPSVLMSCGNRLGLATADMADNKAVIESP